MSRTFDLTDGVTTISLVDSSSTGITTEYQSYSQPDLPYIEGRIAERWTFALKASSQNNAASQIQALNKLARQAREFHESIWRTKPVYLKQQTSSESNARYATVYEISSIQAPDPFAVSLEAGTPGISSLITGLEMTIIREHPWGSTAPNTLGSALTLSPSDGTGSPNLVQVANFRDDIAVDIIKVDDGGAFGSNLASSSNFNLFPASPAVNDALYIGASEPWKHIVFNVGTAADWNVGISVGYYNGSWTEASQGEWWTSFGEGTGAHSSNDLFDTAGEWSIAIKPPSDWVGTSVDGDTRYWARLRLNTVTASTTVPVNGTSPYTQRSPYMEVPAASIKGDAPPLMNVRMWSPDGGTGSPSFATPSLILIGAKSRNLSNFTSHLNAGGNDNPVAWTTTYGTDGTSSVGTASPGFAHCAVDFGGDTSMVNRVQFSGAQLLDDYVGEYMAFVRCQQVGGSAGDCQLKLVTYLGGNSLYDSHVDSKTEKTRAADLGNEVLTLGLLRIPFARAYNSDDMGSVSVIFQIHAERTTGSSTLNIYDLVLLPVDEGIVGLLDPVSDTTSGSSALRGGTVLDLDAGVLADRNLKYRYISGDLIPVEAWARMDKPIPFANLATTTRLYFLILHYSSWGQEPFLSTLGSQLAIELYGRYRYSILRGSD